MPLDPAAFERATEHVKQFGQEPRLMAIDPGPEVSSWVILNREGKLCNMELDCENKDVARVCRWWVSEVVIESVESYGMPVGRDVFQTCYWIGAFREAAEQGDGRAKVTLLARKEVKLHLCQTPRAKDSNIRQALLDRYGPGKEKAVGKKASPGPLYGVKRHLWSALALGVTYLDRKEAGG